jgi:excinuclease UvrABC helicase subunit UvrB
MLMLDNEKINFKEKQKQNKTHIFFTLNPTYLEREKVRTPSMERLLVPLALLHHPFITIKEETWWTMCCSLIGQCVAFL